MKEKATDVSNLVGKCDGIFQLNIFECMTTIIIFTDVERDVHLFQSQGSLSTNNNVKQLSSLFKILTFVEDCFITNKLKVSYNKSIISDALKEGISQCMRCMTCNSA